MGSCMSSKCQQRKPERKQLYLASEHEVGAKEHNKVPPVSPSSRVESIAEIQNKIKAQQKREHQIQNNNDLFVINEVSEPSHMLSSVMLRHTFQSQKSRSIQEYNNPNSALSPRRQIHNNHDEQNSEDSDEVDDDLEVPEENHRELRCLLCNQMIFLGNHSSQEGYMLHLDNECEVRLQAQPHFMGQEYINHNSADDMAWHKNVMKDGSISWIKKKSEKKSRLHKANIRNLPLAKTKKLLLEDKKLWFEAKCTERRISFLQDSITLVIERDHILRDSFEQFRTTDQFDLHKEIKIFYVGEVAQDAGGLIREWITELTKSLFSENTGLFKQTKSRDDFSYFPSAKAKYIYDEQYTEYFRFAGQVLAKALFEKIPVMVKLNKSLLKRLIGNKQTADSITVEDLKDYDPQIYQSLKFIAEDPNIIFEDEDFRFNLMNDEGMDIDLVKNGKDIQVNNSNKLEYASKVAQYYLVKEVKPEVKAFLKGFYQVIPQNNIQVFDSDELDFLMGGVPEINIDDWKMYTVYKGEYNANHKTIKWFWETLQTLSQEDLRKFLLFTIGMPRVPIEGFKALQSNRNRTCKFQIQSIPFTNTRISFMKAHTCFNRLEIPLFPSKVDLENNIKGILQQEQFFFDFE